MRPFVKVVDPSTIQNEVELQKVAIMYGYSPQIFNVTVDEIYMEDLEAPCLADIYGEEAESIPDWIWESIRSMIECLYKYEGIEYTDITPYNFIEKDDKIYKDLKRKAEDEILRGADVICTTCVSAFD